jgi:hypothetical protein
MGGAAAMMAARQAAATAERAAAEEEERAEWAERAAVGWATVEEVRAVAIAMGL